MDDFETDGVVTVDGEDSSMKKRKKKNASKSFKDMEDQSERRATRDRLFYLAHT